MRSNPISINIYRRHLKLFRYINDTWIFLRLIRPKLKLLSDTFGASTSKAKKLYQVPKKGKNVLSKRLDADVHSLLLRQHDRGLYESLIVSIISRAEIYLVECLVEVILAHPAKLAVLVDDRVGVPLDMFLAGPDKQAILAEMIRIKSEGLTFLPPAKYIERVEKALSIELDASVVAQFIEAKASRDLIVHADGLINAAYRKKAGDLARGQLGDTLIIDEDYFRHIIVTTKQLSGEIASKIEEKFG